MINEFRRPCTNSEHLKALSDNAPLKRLPTTMRANGLKYLGKPAVDDLFVDELKVEGLEP